MQPLPFCEATERNKGPLAEVLSDYLKAPGLCFELGSGTGQHIEYFHQVFSHIEWRPSEVKENLDILQSRLSLLNAVNILPLVEYQAGKNRPSPDTQYDYSFTANTFHIMSWEEVCFFLKDLGALLKDKGLFFVYGPFRYDGEFIGKGNFAFDQKLRSLKSSMGIREISDIIEESQKYKIQHKERIDLPANNQLHIFQKVN